MLEFVSNLRSERHLNIETNLETSHNSSLLELRVRVKRTMILFRRMYRWKKIVLGNFHSSCRIEFPIYSISRIRFSQSITLSSSRFQQERAVPSNLVRFFENSRTVTDSSLSNDFSRIHFQIHPCVRETERESARTQNFWPYTSPLHSSRSRR